MRLLRVVLSAVFCLSISLPIVAQSTSPWQKVAESSFGDTTTPGPGNAYMTLYVRAASVYQDSNWWTNFVETNRQAVLTVNLDGTIAGVHVSQTKTGNAVELHRNRSAVGLGFSGLVVDHLPMTFSGLTFDLQINKTAKDGLQNLIAEVSNLSQTQPPTLSISQQAMGITTLSKDMADFLFKNNLLVKKLTTQSPLPAAGLLAPGVYVCLAGDSEADYNQYLTPDLKWTGSQVTFKDVPLDKLSYFVVEVGYNKRYFAQATDALSFGAVPWVALYQLAQREISTINTAADATKVGDDIQSHLADARALLDADPDFIQDEKDDIADAVYQKINGAYHKRLTLVGIVTSPTAAAAATNGTAVAVATNGAVGDTPVAGVGGTPVRPNLDVVDPKLQQFHMENMQGIQLKGQYQMGPTGGGSH